MDESYDLFHQPVGTDKNSNHDGPPVVALPAHVICTSPLVDTTPDRLGTRTNALL